MTVNVTQEVAALQRLTIHELRDKFAELFGEPTRAGNRTWLIRRIAWRLQALAEGDLSERARQRAAELAQDADLRVLAPRATNVTAEGPSVRGKVDPRLRPGTVLTRVYKGQTLQVQVRADGFADGVSVAAFVARGARTRRSASWASSAARWRARSDRSPSASACNRQAIRRINQVRLPARVGSPNNSANLSRSSWMVSRCKAATSWVTFTDMERSSELEKREKRGRKVETDSV